MTTKKLNPNWDSLLTPYQRELLTKPGFGISKDLPYLKEEDVKKIMIISEEYIRHVDLITQLSHLKNQEKPVNSLTFQRI